MVQYRVPIFCAMVLTERIWRDRPTISRLRAGSMLHWKTKATDNHLSDEGLPVLQNGGRHERA